MDNDFIAAIFEGNLAYVLSHMEEVSQGVLGEGLYTACCQNRVNIASALLDAGADTWAVGLFEAAENGHLEIVKLLVGAGADIHQMRDFSLRWAARNGHLEVVRFLLEAGADVNAKNGTALRWAEKYGHADIAELLKRGTREYKYKELP